MHLYTNFHLPKAGLHQSYEEDITDRVEAKGNTLCVFGLRQGNDLLLFAGSTADETVTTSVRVRDTLSGSYHLREFNSLLGEWREEGLRPASEIMSGYILQIERKGFSLLELTQEV